MRPEGATLRSIGGRPIANQLNSDFLAGFSLNSSADRVLYNASFVRVSALPVPKSVTHSCWPPLAPAFWPAFPSCWLPLALIGDRWRPLASVGPRLPPLAPVGHSLSQLLTPVGPRWPPLAPIGPRWPPLAHVGPLFLQSSLSLFLSLCLSFSLFLYLSRRPVTGARSMGTCPVPSSFSFLVPFPFPCPLTFPAAL